jgi:hypothetical protein
MASTKGYKYNTEEEAITAQKICNAFYGIPKSETDVTQNWCSYEFSENFLYIVYHESLEPILGEPIEFQLTQYEATN